VIIVLTKTQQVAKHVKLLMLFLIRKHVVNALCQIVQPVKLVFLQVV